MPLAVEYVNGIAMIVRKAGIAVLRRRQSRSATPCIISAPTATSAGAVANAGIAVKIGARKSASTNSPAVTTDASPVRPPSSTPAADSTYDVTVLVPSSAPAIVPTASAANARLEIGRARVGEGGS